jgi:hypothetical protein
MRNVLCYAFQNISYRVWKWMKRASLVRNPSMAKTAPYWGMQLRETTLTDYVVLRLLEKCGNFIDVFTFPSEIEAQIGADMELWLTDHSGNWLGLRIQCKIMGPNGEFRQLHHKIRNGNVYQWDALIHSSALHPGCLPIYLLYVGPYPVRLRLTPRPHYFYMARGNWWISAYRIKQLYPKQNIKDLWPYMHPWECLVCCHSFMSVNDVLNVLKNTVFRDDNEAQDIRIANSPPQYVQLAREGRLPDSVDELRSLLKGREMRHLIIVSPQGGGRG